MGGDRLNVFDDDFEFDGISHVSGVFSEKFVGTCLSGCPVAVDQTYRARAFLKFANELYKRHKGDFKRGSHVDVRVQMVEHPRVGPILVVKIGELVYGLCPTREE